MSSILTSSNGFADPTDTTKEVSFDVSGVSTETTRTITIPDGDLTIAGTNTDQNWTGSQRSADVVDNDGSFDLDAGNNFECTPTGNITLTFTNQADGQSGFILLDNSGGHTVSAHTNTKVDANFLSTVTTAGKYLVSYYSDGTNTYVANSGALS